MTPQYKATEFTFNPADNTGIDDYPRSLKEHIRDHAHDNWEIQQIFPVRCDRDSREHFGVLWTRRKMLRSDPSGYLPDVETA